LLHRPRIAALHKTVNLLFRKDRFVSCRAPTRLLWIAERVKGEKLIVIRILPYQCSVDLNFGILMCSPKCSKNERFGDITEAPRRVSPETRLLVLRFLGKRTPVTGVL
jgi:hypothetical protein